MSTIVIVDDQAVNGTIYAKIASSIADDVLRANREQAEIFATAQHDYDVAPTPSHQLKLALILGTPGHPATNLPKAQGLLRELMANPETLLPGERALAVVQLSQIDDHLTLDAENRRRRQERYAANLRGEEARGHAGHHHISGEAVVVGHARAYREP